MCSSPGSRARYCLSVRCKRPAISISRSPIRSRSLGRCWTKIGSMLQVSQGAAPYPYGVELPIPDPPLSDGVVALRVPTEQDLPAIERRIGDPDIVRWMGPLDHTAGEVLDL